MGFLDALRVDCRHSIRRLRQAPGLSIIVLSTITIVLIANTTIFSLLDAIVLRKVAVASPDQLVAISAADPRTNTPGYFYKDTVDAFRSAQRSFTQLAMYNGGGVLRVEPEGAAPIDAGVEAVTPEYFELARVHPAAGRFWTLADDPNPTTVVLSHRLAERIFGDANSAVNKQLKINSVPLTVIGVVERGYSGLAFDGGADLFLSFPTLRAVLTNPNPAIRAPYLIGRLADDASLDEARAELAARFPAIQDATIGSVPPAARAAVSTQRVQLESLANGFSGLRRQYGRSLIVLMGLAAVLLAVGAINLSGLLLARGLRRHHEFAVQRALGATRGRLLRQSILDGLFLAMAALMFAIPIAWWLTAQVTPALVARALPLQYPLTPTPGVLAMAAITTIVTGMVIGALPGYRAVSVRIDDVLRGGRGVIKGMGWAGRGVIVAQVALAMVLVMGAGLFVATLANLYSNDSATRTQPILWTRLAVNSGVRDTPSVGYLRSLVDELSKVGGVEAVALSFYYPAYLGFPGSLSNTTITTDGVADDTKVAMGLTELISPGFFDLSGIARISGRDFTWSDDPGAPPVAIISQSVADRLFAGGDPIGRQLKTTVNGAVTRLTIVGVAANAPIGRIDEPDLPVVFRPITQTLAQAVNPLAHIRVNGDLALAREGYVDVVNRLGRNNVRALFTMDDWVDQALLQQRLVANVSMIAAVISLLLAAIGVFCVMAYSVALRAREIGIRMSIGATRASIAKMVVQEGLIVVVAGVAIGTPLAVAASRVARAQLYGVSAGDPSMAAAAAFVFLITAALAALLPAARAARIQPMDALRQQ